MLSTTPLQLSTTLSTMLLQLSIIQHQWSTTPLPWSTTRPALLSTLTKCTEDLTTELYTRFAPLLWWPALSPCATRPTTQCTTLLLTTTWFTKFSLHSTTS